MIEDMATEEVMVDIPTIDATGNPLTLKRVPVLREVATGKYIIDPQQVARAEAEAIAERFNLEGREVPVLLTLFAEAGYFRPGVVLGLSKFHKLLFYQMKRLETLGLDRAFLHEEFAPARGGPVSLSLKADLKHLEEKGLVAVTWSKDVTSPTVVELTQAGLRLAEKVWRATPEAMKSVAVEVKEDIYPMSGAGMRERAHEEHPRDRRVYTKSRKQSR